MPGGLRVAVIGSVPAREEGGSCDARFRLL